MATVEDSVILIRSVLCSKKGPISLKELSDDYYESNGSRIPFRELGFSSLPAFLCTLPDKFRLNQNGADYTIAAVLDQNLTDLARLVQGQKNTKKKKKSKAPPRPVYRKPSLYSNFAFNSKKSGPGFQAPTFYNSKLKKEHSTEFTSKQFNRYSQPVAPKMVSKIDPRPLSNMMNMLNINRNDNNIIKKKMSTPNEACLLQMNLDINNKENSMSDLNIENAAFWLKEHMIYLSHVESMDKIYIRLIGENFPVMYDKMSEELQKHEPKIPIDVKNTKENSICIGRCNKSNKYYRVIIKEIEKTSQPKMLCFLVDEGRTEYFQASELLAIPSKFLDPRKYKFQAIEVQVNYFTMLEASEYILNLIRKELGRKKYLARKIQGTQKLTISIYNSRNECMDKIFFNKYDNFMQWKQKPGEEFSAFISFIDDDSSLVYLQLPGDLKDKFDYKMVEINKFYSNQKQAVADLDYFRKIINDLNFSEIFCAKYELDQNWYRCKIMRKWDDIKVMVHFIDFGNKEKISLTNLRMIPSEFSDFKYLPPQAFTVLILSKEKNEEELKSCLFDYKLVTFKVAKINARGIPSVSIINAVDVGATEEIESPPEGQPIKLENQLRTYEQLTKEMNSFYLNRPAKFLTDSLIKDQVYVGRNEANGECHRVKFIDYLANKFARIYHIDACKFDAVIINTEYKFFHIKKEFLQFDPLNTKEKSSTESKESYSVTQSKNSNKQGGLNSSLFIEEKCDDNNLNEIMTVKLEDLAETNLPVKSEVYVSNINNPFDFVINLESSRRVYEQLRKEMNTFYLYSPEKFLTNSPKKEHVYVGRNEATGECTRIKFIDYLADKYARIYDIDAGHFDAVQINTEYTLFYITKEFLRLKPLGIKARLSNVTYENSTTSQWSMATKSYFRSLVKDKRVFKANIVKFDWKTNIFNIELYNESGDSINKNLVKLGFAMSC